MTLALVPLFLALGGIAAVVLALNVLTGYLEARVRRWEYKALAAAEEQHRADAAALIALAERVRRERQALATDVPPPPPSPMAWKPSQSPVEARQWPLAPEPVGDDAPLRYKPGALAYGSNPERRWT